VLFERVAREVGVSLHDVDNNRTPGSDISHLGFFVQFDVVADDICA